MDSETIERYAADWVVRRHQDRWSEADQTGLDSWLAQSTGHRVAYLRLRRVWTETDRLKALGAGVPAEVIPPPGSWNLQPSRRPEFAGVATNRSSSGARRAALAASLILALSGGIYWAFARMERPEQYTTRVGGLEVVRLGDGSELTLNTNTRVRAVMGAAERRIELISGEAYFAVAKDPSRPFVVVAGSQSVKDVGTQFSVRRTASDLQVLVAEGQVQLGSTAPEPALLEAGDLARSTGDTVRIRRVSQNDVERLLSWRGGFVTFQDTLLPDAIAEFNRYQTRKLVIEDPSLASIKVVGRFRTNNLEGFLSLLEQGFPVVVQQRGEHIGLKRRM